MLEMTFYVLAAQSALERKRLLHTRDRELPAFPFHRMLCPRQLAQSV